LNGLFLRIAKPYWKKLSGSYQNQKELSKKGLIYDLYKKIGWNDYRNAANEALLDRLEQEREGK